ncbi:MAG TPA: hypothetical protein VFE96_00305, partial [Candidatus Bathyarchaeia archaeon]|nr:hypothetical protein [Candidatus Bathyarchaeia archaeon]
MDDSPHKLEAVPLRLRATVPVLILATALLLILPVSAASYTLSISPSNPIGLGGSVLLTTTLTGGSKNTVYAVTFSVLKPNGTGFAIISQSFTTNSVGSGSASVQYPTSSWTVINGTCACTDTAGIYSVALNQTAPTNTGTQVRAQFTVSSVLNVVISQPSSASIIQRGQIETITATVSNALGPVNGASVTVNTPSNGALYLPQVTSSNGVYSANYQVL